MTETKAPPNPAELAALIDSGQMFPRQISQGEWYGRLLAEHLRQEGWRLTEMHSTCTKATFECRMKKGIRAVTITSAVFFGPFTTIQPY